MLIGLVRNAAATSESINAMAMRPYSPVSRFITNFSQSPFNALHQYNWLISEDDRAMTSYAKFVNWIQFLSKHTN